MNIQIYDNLGKLHEIETPKHMSTIQVKIWNGFELVSSTDFEVKHKLVKKYLWERDYCNLNKKYSVITNGYSVHAPDNLNTCPWRKVEGSEIKEEE